MKEDKTVWDILEQFTTIFANSAAIITFLGGIFIYLFYFGGKKFKVINLYSLKFNHQLAEDDIIRLLKFTKKYEEIKEIQYEGVISKSNFVIQTASELETIKKKYGDIIAIGIAEQFIFVLLGYYFQNTAYIRGFRKLKNSHNLRKFSGSDWAWPKWYNLLKWGVGIQGLIKGWTNNFIEEGIDIIKDNPKSKQIILKIESSYKIDNNDLPNGLSKLNIVNFSLQKVDGMYLINEGQVQKFYKKISLIIRKIDEGLGPNGVVHVFYTLPPPLCIKLGQSIHRNGPEFIFYDLNRNTNCYEKDFSTSEIIL